MYILLSWLKEFAPLTGTAEEIADQLIELGLEIESTREIGAIFDQVVVARAAAIRPHPNADRIRIVDVDTGSGELHQVCCGAWNFEEGDVVPFAPIGTHMPNGMLIEARKMRGEPSNGMLCSSAELELDADHGGLMILDRDLELGQSLSDALGVGTDIVFEFDSLPNRPETLSMLGVARDIAAKQGVEFTIPEISTSDVQAELSPRITIDAPEVGGHFHLRRYSNVKVGPSPYWMVQRLEAAGMRSINNVVDISNYVMLELGQPNHIYDASLIAGESFRVRFASDGERFTTLDGVERTLVATDGVIVDAEDTPIGLCGVMGGSSTEISDSTTDIWVETAWWDPQRITNTSSRLHLHSEASLRYKRGVDHEIATLAQARLGELLSDLTGAQPQKIDGTAQQIVAWGNLPKERSITVRPERVSSLLGVELDGAAIESLINPIGFTTQQGDHGTLVVAVPTWRPDCTIEADIAEEVSRHYGMSNIPKTIPLSPHRGGLSTAQQLKRALRRSVEGAGLFEIKPMPFLAPGDLERVGLPPSPLKLSNPLVAEETVLRSSLLPGILKTISYNIRHRQNDLRFFEIGHVFAVENNVLTDVATSSLANRVVDGEHEVFAAAIAHAEVDEAVQLLEQVLWSLQRLRRAVPPGPHVGTVGEQAFRLEQGELAGLHPGRGARVILDDIVVGSVGEVDPRACKAYGFDVRVAWVELDLDAVLALPADPRVEVPISRYPGNDFDLAFVVPEGVAVSSIQSTIVGAVGDVLAGISVFDVFDLPDTAGHRSVAFHVQCIAPDRTLTDDEIGVIRENILTSVEQQHGITIRR